MSIEIGKTKDNKKTQHAVGLMKAKLAMLKDKAVQRASAGKASGDDGLWDATFEPLAADAKGRELKVNAGEKTIKMENIVIGDVWVMNGQSNMAFALKAVYQNHYKSSPWRAESRT